MLESVLEGSVAQGITGRVDSAVDVAQPVSNGPERVGNAGGAKGVDKDHDVVWRPGGHKHHQYSHDSPRHLPLPRGIAPLGGLSHKATFGHLEQVP